MRTLIVNGIPDLTASEARVARFVLDNEDEVPFLSLLALADRSGTSEATVARCCVALGYSGFQEFKVAFTAELIQRGKPRSPRQIDRTTYPAIVGRDIAATLDAVRGGHVDAIVERLVTTRVVVLAGVAGSGSVAEIMAAGLLGADVPAVRISDRIGMERWSAMVDARDAFIGISHSGAASEVVAGVRRARERRAFTVAITSAETNPLHGVADVTLTTRTEERVLGSNSCHPRIAQLALLEMVLDGITHVRARSADA